MAKLLVAGCSFSDYTKVEKVYGEFLSEKLNFSEYIHEARGCGSNYRMWRKIVDHVSKKNISSDDVIIVQYTEALRQEFWTPYRRPVVTKPRVYQESEPFNDDGTIIRFKTDSFKWQKANIEKKFFKLLEQFINQDFENEKFRVNHQMFQAFMIYNNFKNLYFLKGGGYGPDYDLIPEYKNNFIDGRHLLEHHLKGDKHHMSQRGHENTADFIYDFLKNQL